MLSTRSSDIRADNLTIAPPSATDGRGGHPITKGEKMNTNDWLLVATVVISLAVTVETLEIWWHRT